MVAQLKRLLASRFRLSTQLYVGIGGAVVLTLAASLVGWFSFDRVGRVQSQVNEGSVPELAAAFSVAEYSAILAAAAPNLTVSHEREEFDEVSADIDRNYTFFQEAVSALEQVRFDEVPGVSAEELLVVGSDTMTTEALVTHIIRQHAESLITNIELIRSETGKVFALIDRREVLQAELADVRGQLEDVLAPAIDDQLFYTLTGYRVIGDPPAARADHLSEDEVARYRTLSELQSDVNIATELLANAFTLSDDTFIEPLRERFEAATSRITRNLGTLEGSAEYDRANPLVARLVELGSGDDGVFNTFERELRIVARQEELLTENRNLSTSLIAEVNTLVGVSQEGAREATLASEDAILTGRWLLLAISALSIVGAVLIMWLFVGRVLLRRIQMLSDWMLRMAGGDLEARVEIGGRDEVTEMAAALEVFRRHALEVQRLNLVEQLAEELQGKNDELEEVLADLQKAQDQIVLREKLAALGELTAGVAHEIRNPLNFVNNFSESSQELVEELREALEEEDVVLGDEREYIEEIIGDLGSNAERINSHGQRAERIVRDMLAMGRGSEEWQVIDINSLVDQHAMLAYHSARALDQNFNLEINQEFDPEAGEIDAIPQDLGRVFLNMVSNACYATDEKRKAAAGNGGEPYSPTLWLTTQRKDDRMEVRIRDNGIGIPPDAVEKIFNPFFTTKPTDKGTGLGLALSSDIVRRHGGLIRVETEPGEFTEMIVDLPVERQEERDPAALAAHPGFE